MMRILIILLLIQNRLLFQRNEWKNNGNSSGSLYVFRWNEIYRLIFELYKVYT